MLGTSLTKDKPRKISDWEVDNETTKNGMNKWTRKKPTSVVTELQIFCSRASGNLDFLDQIHYEFTAHEYLILSFHIY